MADKFLVISSVKDDEKELSKINDLIIDNYPNEYVATTDETDVLFKYSHDFESTLKNILRKPEFINTHILSIGEYAFDESTGEWLEESSNTIFEKGYDVENQISTSHDLNNLPNYDNYDDLPEFNNYSNSNQYDSNEYNNEQNNSENNYYNHALGDYRLSDEDFETKSIDEIQQEDNKRYNANNNNNNNNIQKRIESSKNNQTLNQDDILYEIVYDVLPTSDEIIDKLNTNLNINDTFENPMSTVVRIIHNSTLQQLYARVEDKIDELYNQDVDGSLDDYRQKLLDNPPKILQDLKDEVIKFRTFSQDSSNDIDNIRSNYEKDLEKYVKEVGERARIEAEEYARQEYMNQNENQTDNQIAEYVNSIKDTYDSMEENIDTLKDRATRTLINDFIKHGQNPALSSALRFIKDKQEIEKQAQNDIDAINQSAYNAQNMQYNQPQMDNDYYMSADNFEAIDDLMIQDEEDLNDEEDESIDEEMNADEIADSMNNIQGDTDFDDDQEDDSEELEEHEEQEESDEQEDLNNEEEENEEESSEESSLDDINEEDLNEIDDEDINIKQPEDDDQSEVEDSDDTPPSEEPDTELEDKNEDDEDSLIEEDDDEEESENESYLDESKGKFKKAIQGNLYDNEEDDDDDLVDQISEDQLDDKKGIESDIIDDINDVDTSKDLDSISESSSSEDKKGNKFSKWIMGIIIAIVILIILSLGTLFVVSEFSGDTEEEKKAEQKAQAEHEQYLKDLKTYILGTDQVVQMGDQTVKVTISKINKDGSVEAEYNDKNKDGEVVKEHTTIDKPVIQTALEKQKKQANKTHNKTIDDEINKDNASDDK